MAQTPEAKVKRKVTDQLKVLGAFYFYPVTGGYGSSGILDIVGCYRGMFFAIECKAGKNKPTELQMHMMGKISAAAGNVMVVNEDNLGDVSEWVINLPLLPLLPTPGR